MNFNMAHMVPSKAMHGLNGYKDVIDSVQWGLQELGHSVSYGLNTVSPSATNIVFGAQVMELPALRDLPPDTIIYNFEQMKGVEMEAIRPQLQVAAQRFRIWDYSDENTKIWQALGAKGVRVVPVCYAPVLSRISKPSNQDIDVLMYGAPGQDRLSAFYYLSASGLTTAYVCGLYGDARDDLIARSKLIVNVNLYDHSKIFEVVRVPYLLANKKAVVAVVDDDTRIDDDMRGAIKCSTRPTLLEDCMALVANSEARNALENTGFQAIQRRDIRHVLENTLTVDAP